jgi:hypothetical protein
MGSVTQLRAFSLLQANMLTSPLWLLRMSLACHTRTPCNGGLRCNQMAVVRFLRKQGCYDLFIPASSWEKFTQHCVLTCMLDSVLGMQ